MHSNSSILPHNHGSARVRARLWLLVCLVMVVCVLVLLNILFLGPSSSHHLSLVPSSASNYVKRFCAETNTDTDTSTATMTIATSGSVHPRSYKLPLLIIAMSTREPIHPNIHPGKNQDFVMTTHHHIHSDSDSNSDSDSATVVPEQTVDASSSSSSSSSSSTHSSFADFHSGLSLTAYMYMTYPARRSIVGLSTLSRILLDNGADSDSGVLGGVGVALPGARQQTLDFYVILYDFSITHLCDGNDYFMLMDDDMKMCSGSQHWYQSILTWATHQHHTQEWSMIRTGIGSNGLILKCHTAQAFIYYLQARWQLAMPTIEIASNNSNSNSNSNDNSNTNKVSSVPLPASVRDSIRAWTSSTLRELPFNVIDMDIDRFLRLRHGQHHIFKQQQQQQQQKLRYTYENQQEIVFRLNLMDHGPVHESTLWSTGHTAERDVDDATVPRCLSSITWTGHLSGNFDMVNCQHWLFSPCQQLTREGDYESIPYVQEPVKHNTPYSDSISEHHQQQARDVASLTLAQLLMSPGSGSSSSSGSAVAFRIADLGVSCSESCRAYSPSFSCSTKLYPLINNCALLRSYYPECATCLLSGATETPCTIGSQRCYINKRSIAATNWCDGKWEGSTRICICAKQ